MCKVFVDGEGDAKTYYEMIPVGKQKYYTPTAEDVGHRLHFTWLPVSVMGVQGQAPHPS